MYNFFPYEWKRAEAVLVSLPISSIPYVLSLNFGYFIDLTMPLLFFVNPHHYISCIAYLLIGCLILGFGVYTEVLADVAMLPGESFVRAVSSTWKTEFGGTKVAFDVSVTVIAAGLSFLFAHRLDGVREGTIIAALLVGFIARLLGRKLSFLEEILFGKSGEVSENTEREEDAAAYDPVIVIDRQYGSGGHDIGEALAKKLGYAFYDNEMIQLAAGSTRYEPEFIKNKEENMTNRFWYDLVSQMYIYSNKQESPKDEIYESESKVIRGLASKGNCIIIGRCADEVLRDRPNTVTVFLHAPKTNRRECIMKSENLSKEEALHRIHKMDKRRSDHYSYYTRRIWGGRKTMILPWIHR